MKRHFLSLLVVCLAPIAFSLGTPVYAKINSMQNIQAVTSIQTAPKVTTNITEGESWKLYKVSQVPQTIISRISNGRYLDMKASSVTPLGGFRYIVLLNNSQAVAFDYGGDSNTFYQWPSILSDHGLTPASFPY